MKDEQINFPLVVILMAIIMILITIWAAFEPVESLRMAP